MKIALVGNPNAGKSSVFNQLTGLRQKTGNFPGVTIDKRSGTALLPSGSPAEIIDLPGTYSLYPNSEDERIVADIFCERSSESFPDAVIYIADINNLERHLLLCSQLIDLEMPVVMALTMNDIAAKRGGFCDIGKLSAALDIPVVKVNGRTGEGLPDLCKAVSENMHRKPHRFSDKIFSEGLIDDIKKILPIENDYAALLTAHHFKGLAFLSEVQKKQIAEAIERHGFSSLSMQVHETLTRYDKIAAVLKAVSSQKPAQQMSLTEKIDKVLTNKVLGSVIFIAILFLLFQAIFSWAACPMLWIDAFFSTLAGYIERHLPAGIFNDLITDGIIPGLAGIFIFIPQIAILFAFIVFLEDVGYMSRAIFLSDSIMRKFGLNGRSMVALFSGLACAVPAIMSARAITNRKERLVTIMVTPFITCSARIPVFVILVALAIPADARLGIFNTQGIAMMGLYLLGVAAALTAAWVMKKIIATGELSCLVMELPSYKTPHWKNIVLTVWEKVKVFVTQAGKIILVISVILWFLSSYGPKRKMEAAEQSVLSEYHGSGYSRQQIDELVAARKMEASYAGHLGRLIEPVIRPLGFDWKIGIALITSFAAREVFVGTLATLYSVGSSDDTESIFRKLQSEVNPATGQLAFAPPTALSLLIFYAFAMQCMSTFAVVKRETKSWKWPILQFIYMTGLAYCASLVTFQVVR